MSYRHVARPLLQRRLYTTKKADIANLIKDETAAKVFSQLDELGLKTAEQLFDDDIVSRTDLENDATSNDDLPRSPIMQTKEWKRRFKPEPKLKKLERHEMTEQQKQILASPYAQALATPIRQETFFNRVLPEFFQQRLKVFVHPETKDPWILPTRIRAKDEWTTTPGQSRYVGSNASTFEFLRSRHWKKLQDNKFVTSGVWRQDMAEFIKKQLRQRVFEELKGSKRVLFTFSENKWNYKDTEIGCVLVWNDVEPWKESSGEAVEATGVTDEAAAVDSTSTAEASEETKPSADSPEAGTSTSTAKARILVKYDDKIVPQYDIRELLGPELSVRLRPFLNLRPDLKKSVVARPRSRDLQMWLWKLAGYLRKPFNPLFDGDLEQIAPIGEDGKPIPRTWMRKLPKPKNKRKLKVDAAKTDQKVDEPDVDSEDNTSTETHIPDKLAS